MMQNGSNFLEASTTPEAMEAFGSAQLQCALITHSFIEISQYYFSEHQFLKRSAQEMLKDMILAYPKSS